MDQQQSLRELIQDGFKGINSRLDQLNGRVYDHEAEIAALKAKEGRVSWSSVGSVIAIIVSAFAALVNFLR